MSLSENVLKKANAAAVCCLYSYLAHATQPPENATLRSIAEGIEETARTADEKECYRARILTQAVRRDDFLADFRLSGLSVSRSGMTACSFTDPEGGVLVAFRGTGKGEWIDNGEGLSGIPEANTYGTYGEGGEELLQRTVMRDYATDQQVQALNWFRSLAARRGWHAGTGITLAGHSKGGNKAQFVAMRSAIVEQCYSFDGQGFSPEAIAALREALGEDFEKRRRRIYSLSAENDYVNVLGERLMPEDNVFFLESQHGYHYMEAILNTDGTLRPEGAQGALSAYVESVSRRLMRLPPPVRKYATLGVTNLLQQFLGDGDPVGGDHVSIEETVVGLGVAVDLLLGGRRE